MPESPDDTGQVEARSDLTSRLEEARRRNQPAADVASGGGAADEGMGTGIRSGIEFVAALLVSVGIGVALDRWLHTSPILLLVMLFLGFGAGLLNVYRAMNGMSYGATYKTPPAASAKATKDETDEI